MSVGRLRQVGISVALGSCVVMGCGGEKSEEAAGAKSEEPAGAKPEEAAPSTPVARATLPDFDTLPTVELPEDFPVDVPLLPGARAVKATPDPESEGSWVAQFSAVDDPATLYAGLADTFAARDWSTQRVDVPDGIILYANKGDRFVTYVLSTDKGKTVVSLLIVAEQP